jgi:Protein of unknown function (DUF3141)
MTPGPHEAQPKTTCSPAFNSARALPEYLIDAMQRGALFLDLLRRRGNDEIEMAARPMATVLRFGHEEIMSGRSLARPTNYSLSRILPLDGVVIDSHKRPVVVVDPRAGEGPGIGGFKAESEIGDALKAGHPVYFIGFCQQPIPGQRFLDVVEGQIQFFEQVVQLHPDAPLPFAIGNCQAGYQTLMVAMLRPDLFGPCLLAGSPVSYWQGVHGRDPMRYTGGLLGGSWLTALTSDLGYGKFDGAWLVQNFDSLSPANWLWGKQYEVYANVDKGGERYLEFEKWWGDFIELNGDELQFLVDNLFINDKLARNQLCSSDGTTFDVRRVASPIVVFASSGDNISPPPQALGWIADVYLNVEDIRAGGQTIVYCLSHTIGHLAIFVSTKVGAEQDEEFVQMIDVIDCLPPGLYEMVIVPRPDDVPLGGFVTGDWIARFEPRSIGDITKLGRNNPADDHAFAAAAKASEMNLAMYRTFLQPWINAFSSQASADMAHALHPLRLSYTMFADANPWMQGVEALATYAAASRRPASPDNPFLQLQSKTSTQITAGLDTYQAARDQMAEEIFFGIYGSPLVQTMFGLDGASEVRPPPGPSVTELAKQKIRSNEYVGKYDVGGFDEALTRAVVYVIGADGVIDQRCALAFNVARKQLMRLSLTAFKGLVRDQFSILLLEPVRALEALTSLVPMADAHNNLLAQTNLIVEAAGPPTFAQQGRLAKLSLVLDASKI